jgi:TPR repeat protein
VNLEAPDDAAVPPSGDTSCWADKDLFKQPPAKGECPICMLTLPVTNDGEAYYSCCGKTLCIGCVYAAKKADKRSLCPFCRTPHHTSDGETFKRLKKRVAANDAVAIFILGWHYRDGLSDLPQDRKKAFQLFIRAGQLGDANAHFSIAVAYENGRGVKRDTKKAKHYWELAAMGGCVLARHKLGKREENAGNMKRAMKHYMVAAVAGYDSSLKKIREGYMNGHATKVDFERALRAHKVAKDERKSDQREAAAAAPNPIGDNLGGLHYFDTLYV